MRNHTFFLLAAVLLLASPLPAQDPPPDLIEAVSKVLRFVGPEYRLSPEDGQWGLAFGIFGEHERKELRFRASAGYTYVIAGTGDEDAEDLDICVYDPLGDEVQCDQSRDKVPIVEFRARRSGEHRAVLRLYRSQLGFAFAGMAVLRKAD